MTAAATGSGPADVVWGRAAGAAWGSALGAGVVLAALPAASTAFGPGWVVPLVTAAVGAAAVNLLVRIAVARGAAIGLAVAQPVLALGWAAIIVPPAVDGASALGGLPDAVARLLSALPPIDPRGPEMALTVAATWWASALAAGAACRTQHRSGGLVALPAVVLFAAGLLVGDPSRDPAGVVPLVLAAAVGVALVVAAAQSGPAVLPTPVAVGGSGRGAAVVRSLGRALAGLVVVALAIGLAGVVTPRVPGLEDRARVDVRDERDLPVDVRLGESPLDGVPAARRADTPTPRFTAEVELPEGHAPTLTWRLAVLDELGPAGWTAGPARYVRAGEVLGAPTAEEADHRAAARVELELGEAPGDTSALPVLDRPTRVAPAGLAFDREAGALAVPADGRRPDRIELDVALPVLGPDDLLTATAPRTPPGAEVPPSVVARAQQLTAGAGTAIQVLSRISEALEADEAITLDPTITGLTRTDILAPAVVGAPQAEAVVLNDGQLAAAFALLARAVGLDARLAVGYETPVEERTATIEVTDADLAVWTEVRFDGIGWVAFPPPTPAGGGAAAEAPTGGGGGGGAVDGALDQQAAADQAAAARPDGGAPAPAPDAVVPPEGDDATSPVVVVAPLVALLLVGAALSGPARRWWVRRRRRSGDPTDRLLGAWDEVAAAVGASSDRTRPEVAEAASALVDEPADLAWLAGSVDAVAFGAEPAAPDDADRAWAVAGVVAAAVSARRGRRERVRAWFRHPPRSRPAGDASASGAAPEQQPQAA